MTGTVNSFYEEKIIPKTNIVQEIVNDFEKNSKPKEDKFKSETNFKENLTNSKEENVKTSSKIFLIFLAGHMSKVQGKVVPSNSRRRNGNPEKKANPCLSRYGSIRDHLIPQIRTSDKSTGTSLEIKIESDKKLNTLNKWKHDPGPTGRAKISQDST